MSGSRGDPGGPSLEGLAGLIVGFPVAYLAAEGLMPGPKHPIHWLITAVGAGVGYAIGTAIFHLKERRDLYGSIFVSAPKKGTRTKAPGRAARDGRTERGTTDDRSSRRR